MWVFLNNAFLSIVQDKDDPGMLMVRARFRGDLERAFPHLHGDLKGATSIEVMETPPPADYRFRARINRSHVARLLNNGVFDIDYTNFKNSVKDAGRHNTYLRVWGEMLRAQEDELVSEMIGAVTRAKVGDRELALDELDALYETHPDSPQGSQAYLRAGIGRAIAHLRAVDGPKKKPVSPRGKKGSPTRSTRRRR